MKFFNSKIEYIIETDVYRQIIASTTSSVLKELEKVDDPIGNSESVLYFRLNNETNMIRKKFLYNLETSL